MTDVQGEFGCERMNKRMSETLVCSSAKPHMASSNASMNTGVLHCQWFISLASEWSIIILPSPHPETPSFYFFWAKAVLVNALKTPANSWIKSTGWQLACFVGDRAALALSASAVMQPVLWEGEKASWPPPLLPHNSAGTLWFLNWETLCFPWKICITLM